MGSTTDVIVVGGGINGVAIAYNLAKQGAKVTLVEKTFIAGGPTGRSSALIRQHYSNEVTARMALRSLKVFQNFTDEIGGECDFTQTGFILGAREEDREMLESNVVLQQSVGIDTRVIDGQEMREIEPDISLKGIALGAYEPDSGYADPAGTADGFAKAAKAHGTKLMLGTKALSVEIDKGRVTGLKTDKGDLAAGAVVVAAGPWSPQLINPTGVELPLEASRHQVCFYKWPSEFKMNVLYADFIEAVYMRPETGNLTLVGSIEASDADNVVKDPDRFDEGVSFDTVTGYAERMVRRYPKMELGDYTTGYSALYDITPDWHSIMDAVPSAEGLYVTAGGSGHGFKLGPAVGEMMANLVLNGKKEGDDIDIFAFDRFEKNRPVTSRYEYSITG